jgi:single-strand selective monofunctional uracil DNA glycosylase
MKTAKAPGSASKKLIAAAQELSQAVAELDFNQELPWVYNPLEYAWAAHQQYLQKYARSTCRVLFLGMNPGPWGMAQTGVPFGEVAAVRDWLQIDAPIGQPARMHPKRPIEGLHCPRSEVSGRRLWGLFASRYATADLFFEEHFVANYCPLVFMEQSARNVTPDKLPSSLRLPLQVLCDQHLVQLIHGLSPDWLIGVGGFAEQCIRRAVAKAAIEAVQVGRILHPSPASPAANKDWSGSAIKQLIQLDVWKHP